MLDKIIIKGAREHNLKSISLELPKNKLIVFTGLSGSGKSSLAFDTIFAEGQRRYIESLSAYARQFLGKMDKPDVDEIEGLSPAISIDQKAGSANPRSTVATITEVYDYLRVLFARIGKPHCVLCKKPIKKLTVDEIVEIVIRKEIEAHKAENSKYEARYHEAGSRSRENTKQPPKSKLQILNSIIILAPAVRGRKGEYHQLLYDFLNAGYSEVRVDGKIKSLRDRIVLSRYRAHTIELVADRVPLGWPLEGNKNFRTHLYEAIETALKYGNNVVTIILDNCLEMTMSSAFSCPNDGFSFPEIEPRFFSFNSPYGACETCHGLGTEFLFSETPCPKCCGARLKDEAMHVLIKDKNIVDITAMTIGDAYNFFTSMLHSMEVGSSSPQIWKSDRDGRDLKIAAPALREITNRLKFMFDVGLDYLMLDRRASTLSGGEAQRIRLASQIGSRLTGTLYVLDEPTIGLHQRDNEKLIKTLEELRDLGNTIIVVEHDEDTIRKSDYLVDFGPGAGRAGGQIVVAGETTSLLSSRGVSRASDAAILSQGERLPHPALVGLATTGNRQSLTLQYLRAEVKIEVPKQRRGESREKLKIVGATENNLKSINVEIPLRRFVCVTGVSGSGKSTLVYDVLHRALAKKLYRSRLNPGKHKALLGLEHLDRVAEIDQSPIGRTPRSNPATYTGVWTEIRDLFTMTEESRLRGWKPGRFSFNVPGGRCEHCEGHGSLAIEMHFLPTVYVKCDVCEGKRFDKETLEVKYKNKNISEILRMTIDEADVFFRDIPPVHDKLKILREVGLGYLELGQSATTLSGGEAQRVKLAAELGASPITERRGRSLYLLDEPTVGLHFEDVKKLLEVLQRLVSLGNSVVVIEHNLDVIKCADWIIDLGPDGGDKGGEVVVAGTPEEVARRAASYTGRYLKRVLSSS